MATDERAPHKPAAPPRADARSAAAAAPAAQNPLRCAGCAEWQWDNPLPGTYTGEFVGMDGEKQTGKVCILHWQSDGKDRAAMREAIKRKTSAGDFDYSGAYFAGNVAFSGELTDASFDSATFSGDASFFSATFSGDASFDSATFSGGASFFSATFSGDASFDRATFKARAVFQLPVPEATDSSPEKPVPSIQFSQTTWEKPELISFQHMPMDRVSFSGMDARKVDFLNVQWPERIWDEVHAESVEDYAAVEKMYRQLRHNFEDNKNYPEANRFYFGEMEMRRKKRAGYRRWFSLTQLYWLSSGYCSRPRRALGVLLVMLAMLTAGFMLAGLRLNASFLAELDGRAAYLPVEIHWSLGLPLGGGWAGLRLWWQHATYALLHVVEVASLSRYRHYTYLSGAGDALGVATIIVIPLQLASFVLAVRRAYKR